MNNERWWFFRTRQTLWCILIAAIGFGFALIRVPTLLGVRVQPTIGLLGGESYDKSGREYVWRVWWLARDDLFDVQAQWLVTGALLVLLAIFVASLLAAIWIILTPDDPASSIVE